jgi:hypothetical protein
MLVCVVFILALLGDTFYNQCSLFFLLHSTTAAFLRDLFATFSGLTGGVLTKSTTFRDW